MMLENNIASIEVTGEAENGVQLLQMLKKNRYDIAIVDIEMPGLSGLEVLQMAAKGTGEYPGHHFYGLQ